LWGQLALPDIVVRAEAPVEYTYYLDLDEPWELVLEEHAVIVRAPAIRYNTPAIDVSNIRYEVAERSFLRDEEEALENLRKGLSQLSKQRARENVTLVRELGRKQTAEFIRTWLMASYDDADAYRIDVIFADEAGSEPAFTEPPR
jgi:thymidine kinase